MSRWLAIVGIGDDGLAGLNDGARRLVEQAEVLVGGARHLAMLPADERERLTWTAPLGLLMNEILQRRGRRVCVLATGDPLWHGIGITLAKQVPMAEMVILPAPSAYSLAAARLGWPLAEVDAITLHGRPLDLLSAYLQPGRRIIALSENGATPAQVATLLCRRGYGQSRMTVLSHMGSISERMVRGTAVAWSAEEIGRAHV